MESRREIRLAKPYFPGPDIVRIQEDIKKILESGWLTCGDYTKQLEKRFAFETFTKRAVAVSSGSAAIHSILLALGVRGGNIIVPSNTFVGTTNPITMAGAEPWFVDSQPDTLNIDPHQVKENINENTRAVIAVHIGGSPCEMDRLARICYDKQVYLIEDAAHAIGAKFFQRPCGSFGIASAFSLSPTKVVTSTEGGIVVTQDEHLANSVETIRNQGRVRWGPVDVEMEGFTYRMSEVLSAVGLTQLAHLDEFVKRRNEIAQHYRKNLPDWLVPQTILDGSTSSYYAYIVTLKEDAPMTRDQLAERLAKVGIETSIYFRPLHLMKMYREKYGFKGGEFPVSEGIGRNTIALPMSNSLTWGDMDYILSEVKKL